MFIATRKKHHKLQKHNLNNTNYDIVYLDDPVVNYEKANTMLKQLSKFYTGAIVRFCDRDFVFNAKVIDSAVPGQISVIDDQGFIHIGKITQHKDFDALAITSPIVKYRAGYNPEKFGGIRVDRSTL